jgi:hypothetical protein
LKGFPDSLRGVRHNGYASQEGEGPLGYPAERSPKPRSMLVFLKFLTGVLKGGAVGLREFFFLRCHIIPPSSWL